MADSNGTAVSPSGAGIRTGVQGGGVALVLEFLSAFDVLTLDARQTAITLTLGTAIVAFAVRIIEARIGRAWLRTVPAK